MLFCLVVLVVDSIAIIALFFFVDTNRQHSFYQLMHQVGVGGASLTACIDGCTQEMVVEGCL